MTPETMILIGLAVSAVAAASAWLGHHFGSQAAPAFGADIAAIHSRLLAFENAAKADMAHPVTAMKSTISNVEAEVAGGAMSVAEKAIEQLLDDSYDQANIKEAQANIVRRAQMRTTLLTKLAPPAA